MRKQKSIKKNMILSIILTSSNFIFPFITYSYVARVLGSVGTGKIAFVNSILSYFSYIAILGIPAYGTRECARVRDDKEKLSHIVQELLIINLMSTFFAYILLTATVLSVPKLANYKVLFVVMGVQIFLNTIGVEWLYNALEEYLYITKRSIILKSVAVLMTFMLIKSDEDYLWYGFLTIFSTSASYVLNFLNLKKIISLKKTQKYNLKKHIRPIKYFFFASIVITLYSNFDISMLGFISTEEQVGYYNAALKIKGIVVSASTAVTSVIVPRMSYYIKKNEKILSKQLVMRSFSVSMLLAIPLATYIILFAENCIMFLCGREFLPVVNILRILMCCILPLVLTNLFGNQILIPLGEEKRYSQSVFVGMWINLILNIVLIPRWGAVGAAIGTLITEIWNVFWMSGSLAKEYRHHILVNGNIVIYLIALLVASVLSCIIHGFIENMNNIAQLFITGIVFLGIYYILLILLKEEVLSQMLVKLKYKIFPDRC